MFCCRWCEVYIIVKTVWFIFDRHLFVWLVRDRQKKTMIKNLEQLNDWYCIPHWWQI